MSEIIKIIDERETQKKKEEKTKREKNKLGFLLGYVQVRFSPINM